MRKSEIKKEIVNQLNEKLLSIEEVISVTLVGSFIDKHDLSGISDIDTVVICKRLDESVFNKCINASSKINLHKCGLTNYSLKINSTFGPLKFDKKNTVVIHLMIYDIESHINHVVASPFTCYDWERSKTYEGVPLKKIFPVGVLQFKDFITARRSLSNYIEDLNNNQISYREYSFDKGQVKEVAKYNTLDDRHKGEFSYHIIKNLITNYNKLKKASNISLSENEFIKNAEKYFIQTEENLVKLKKIVKVKSNRGGKFPKGTVELTKQFIGKFQRSIINDWEDSINIFFIRHFKTDLNDNTFLGQRRDPEIKEIKSKLQLDDIDCIYSSPMLRTIQTAEIISKKKEIIIDKRLKEIDYGLAEGLDYDELHHGFPYIIEGWKSKKDMSFPDGENTEDVLVRLKSFLKFLKKDLNANNKKKIGIVTHNVILRCLIGTYYKINLNDWHKLIIPHGIIFEFKFKNNYFYPNLDRRLLQSIMKNIVFRVI